MFPGDVAVFRLPLLLLLLLELALEFAALDPGPLLVAAAPPAPEVRFLPFLLTALRRSFFKGAAIVVGFE